MLLDGFFFHPEVLFDRKEVWNRGHAWSLVSSVFRSFTRIDLAENQLEAAGDQLSTFEGVLLREDVGAVQQAFFDCHCDNFRSLADLWSTRLFSDAAHP